MNDNFLSSANAPYVAELYFKYKNDPNSVEENWKFFFNSLNEDEIAVLGDFGGPKWKKRPSNIIDEVSFNQTINLKPNINSQSFKLSTLDSIRALIFDSALPLLPETIAPA